MRIEVWKWYHQYGYVKIYVLGLKKIVHWLLKRYIPNKTDFIYVSVRKLTKDIGNNYDYIKVLPNL